MDIEDESEPNISFIPPIPPISFQDTSSSQEIVPTAFGTEGVRMLVHLKQLLETPELVAIHPKFSDLIIS